MIPLMKNAFLNEEETKKALSDFILNAKKLSIGEKCEEFEKAFSIFQERKHAILFNSGGSSNLALLQALKNLGRLKDGDAVGFSTLTWSTNVMPVIQMGLVPVAVDIVPETLNVMSSNLNERLKDAPMKAFFITNALGFTGDMDNIRKTCADQNIILIEDNCESLGTELPYGRAGNFGLAATFSFFVAHHMSTIEGGMVCTDDPELDEMLRIVRANGWDRNLQTHQQKKIRDKHRIPDEFTAKYSFYDLGYNLRPTEITGFLGLYQLRFLKDSLATRERNYLKVDEAIRKNPDLIPVRHDYLKKKPAFAMPVLCRTPELRARYIARFQEAGIEIRPMIAGNIQDQPFYRKYVRKCYDLPGATFVHQCGFYFGNYPELEEAELKVMTSCLEK